MGLLDNFLGNDNENPGFRGKFRQIFEIAKPSLKLSEEQEEKIREIFKEFQTERKGLKTIQVINQHDQIKEARKKAKQKLMDVLNTDQKKIFTENIDKWRKMARK